MKWKYNLSIKMDIETVTGLYIGGNAEQYEVGGLDNPVIKTKKNGKEIPYIPGSSLKGKIRALLETYEEEKKDLVKKVFGIGASQGTNKTRILFRDFYPKTEEFNDILEVKYENAINDEGKANPRPLERVVPTTTFNGELIVKVYDQDNVEEELELLSQGFKYLMDDYLGGAGSRGNGKVKIKNIVIEKHDRSYYDENKAKRVEWDLGKKLSKDIKELIK